MVRELRSPLLAPTIELVAPRVLVTLGVSAYHSVCEVYDLEPRPFAEAVNDDQPCHLPGDTLYFPRYHCGSRILNTHRPFDRQVLDWRAVGEALRAAPIPG